MGAQWLGVSCVSILHGRSALPHAHCRDAGDSVAGCTVHLVDETLDGGRRLARAEVPVLPGDDANSLAARVLQQEHRLYPQVVRDLIEGRLGLEPAASEHQQHAKEAVK